MDKKRLYISADIEGVAGVVTIEQLMPSGFEYQRACEWMTAEVVAACEAAFEHGVDEIVISDSHGNGQNLLLDKLPDNVQVVRSWPRPLGMMQGIEVGNYVGALLLGYHSGGSDLRGVLAHTMSSRGIAEVRLNGEVASETTISAATAAQFGVPVIMVSGDDAYIEHANQVLGNVQGAVTKWAESTTSARNLLPREACQVIKAKVATALESVGQYQPYHIRTPVEVEVRLLNRKAAELLEYLPAIERVDSHTVRLVCEDMEAVNKFLIFLVSCGVTSV